VEAFVPAVPVVSNYSWVCFSCRTSHRQPSTAKQVKCASCGEPCECLGYKIPVPPKSKPKDWEKLRLAFYQSRNQGASQASNGARPPSARSGAGNRQARRDGTKPRSHDRSEAFEEAACEAALLTSLAQGPRRGTLSQGAVGPPSRSGADFPTGVRVQRDSDRRDAASH
jgi:LSD1 subclass zinc finger protein